LGPNLRNKVVSAPQAECTPEAESIFLGNWGDLGGVRSYLGMFRGATSRKAHLFGKQKCTSTDKILATPMIESPLYDSLGLDVTATFDLVSSKSDWFIFVPNCS